MSAPMNRSTEMSCPGCCAKVVEPHAVGCTADDANSIAEQALNDAMELAYPIAAQSENGKRGAFAKGWHAHAVLGAFPFAVPSKDGDPLPQGTGLATVGEGVDTKMFHDLLTKAHKAEIAFSKSASSRDAYTAFDEASAARKALIVHLTAYGAQQRDAGRQSVFATSAPLLVVSAIIDVPKLLGECCLTEAGVRLFLNGAKLSLAPFDIEAIIKATLAHASSPSFFKVSTWNNAAILPDDEMTVLLALDDGDVWPGYRDGDVWRCVSANVIDSARVKFWMHMPEGPVAQQREKDGE